MLRLKMTRRDAKRKYPNGYERLLPWILGVTLIGVILLIIVVALVLTGVFP